MSKKETDMTTLDKLDMVRKMLPNARVEHDNSGEVVIYTGIFMHEKSVKDNTMQEKPEKTSDPILPVENTTNLFDFGDGAGPVPAKRHKNPDNTTGGWVADTARVERTATIGKDALVFGYAWVFDDALVFENAHVGEGAQVCDQSQIYGNVQILGKTQVSGCSKVGGHQILKGDSKYHSVHFHSVHLW